jgi:hypothetical protein
VRNVDEIARAKMLVIRQLSRREIGVSQQRALLNGMLAALNWVEGQHVPALQRIVDGQDILIDNDARIAGPSQLPPGRRILTG